MLQSKTTDPSSKDCGCLDRFHTGPHWIYEDRLWHDRNREILDAALTCHGMQSGALLQRFAEEEINRLDQKRRELIRRGLDRVPGTVEGEPNYEQQ